MADNQRMIFRIVIIVLLTTPFWGIGFIIGIYNSFGSEKEKNFLYSLSPQNIDSIEIDMNIDNGNPIAKVCRYSISSKTEILYFLNNFRDLENFTIEHPITTARFIVIINTNEKSIKIRMLKMSNKPYVSLETDFGVFKSYQLLDWVNYHIDKCKKEN